MAKFVTLLNIIDFLFIVLGSSLDAYIGTTLIRLVELFNPCIKLVTFINSDRLDVIFVVEYILFYKVYNKNHNITK